MPASATTNFQAAAAQEASMRTLTAAIKAKAGFTGGSNYAISVASGGLLTPDMVADLRLRDLWRFSECYTVCQALGYTITYTVA